MHTLSVVRVAAESTIVPALQFRSPLHVRSELAVGANVWYSKVLQLRTALQAMGAAVLLKVPVTHDAHMRSDVGVAARVWPCPKPHTVVLVHCWSDVAVAATEGSEPTDNTLTTLELRSSARANILADHIAGRRARGQSKLIRYAPAPHATVCRVGDSLERAPAAGSTHTELMRNDNTPQARPHGCAQGTYLELAICLPGPQLATHTLPSR